MALAGGTRAGVRRPSAGRPTTAEGTIDAATAAWLAAIPCALIAAAAIALLGPPLGDVLFSGRDQFTFLPSSAAGSFDDSTEHARYLLALGVPILLSLATWWIVRRQPPIPAQALRVAIPLAQVAFAALLVGCVVAQYEIVYGTVYTRVVGITVRERYFNPATLAAAGVLAGALLLAARSAPLRERAGALARETPAWRWGALAAAVLLTAIWMLHAVNTEESIASVLEAVRYHLEFTLDEAFAVINGRTPLVDFSAQYSSLWPFLTALVMGVAGDSVLTFTLTMCTLTSLALLAIYGVLRRVTRSSAVALALYVPFLATSLFAIGEASVNRGSFGNYYGIFPLRYAGPYFVAWLTVRQLERREHASARGLWVLFAVAGLVLINNADFGAAAVGASVAALVWTAGERRSLRTLAAGFAAGLATAVALVALLTLVRAGSLPQPDRIVDYARIYGVGGYAMLPLPGTFGLHLAIYLTYVAAIVVASVRALRRAPNLALTGMLAWSGVFGLGAASYYVGRSQIEALRTTFSAWALAVALLTYVALGWLARRPPARVSIGAVAALVAFGIALCSIPQIPTPWSQLDRIQAGFVASRESPFPHPLVPPADASTRTFVSSLADGPSRFVVRAGAPVGVLITTGHRVADAYGIDDISPYTGVESIHTVEQVRAVVDALRDAGGNTLVIPTRVDPGMLEAFGREGFALLTPRGLRPYDPERGVRAALTQPWFGEALLKMVDTRHLHPRALAP